MPHRKRPWSMLRSLLTVLWASAALWTVSGIVSLAGAEDCPEEPPLKNFTGAGDVVCPCFIAGEHGGAVLEAPPEHYPIEILRVGIGWGSAFGGTPQSLEQAIHIYDAGLPDPGTPIFSLEGPVMTDGFINEFDLEPLPGEIIIDSGEFTVTLEFASSPGGDPYAPSMVHDGNGCQLGKNVCYIIPGGWFDACLLGVSGDWVVQVVYRQTGCGTGVGEEYFLTTAPGVLLRARPNPFAEETRFEFALVGPAYVDLSVHDVNGRLVTTLARGTRSPGQYVESWSGNGADGAPVPSGIYFVTLTAGNTRSTQRVILNR